jgi:hypothetical protein
MVASVIARTEFTTARAGLRYACCEKAKQRGEVAKTFRVHGMTIYRLAAAEASLKA